MRRIVNKIAQIGLMFWALLGRSHADELSRNDKLRALYSNQFAFDQHGVPLITVRIAEGCTEVTIESSAKLHVLPDGEDGSEVSGGKRWKVTLHRGKAATLEYFVVLAREPIAALVKLRQEMSLWQKRGVHCRLIEIGTVFGVKGNVFDNRVYMLADGPYSSRQEALNAALEKEKKYGLGKIALLPQLKARPSGLFKAEDLETLARVTVRDAIWFAPTRGERLIVHASSQGKPRSYWGQVYITVDTNGTMAVVNAIPANRLLAGLVPSEIYPQAHEAALRAQAVAARGELLAKIGTRHLVDPYLLCSTQHCQVYGGAGQEHPRTTAAVNATRGIVLVRRDGSLVDTVYSASCGGHTEHNDNTWPVRADPHLRGHLDADEAGTGQLAAFRRGIQPSDLETWLGPQPKTWCGRSRFNQDKYRWSVSIPWARASSLVRKLGVGTLKAIRVLRRGISGRVNLMEITGSLATRMVSGELDIRQLFGGLRSSMFVVQPIAGPDGQLTAFIFRGGGWGHGVGMCQTGAIGMAEAGKSY